MPVGQTALHRGPACGSGSAQTAFAPVQARPRDTASRRRLPVASLRSAMSQCARLPRDGLRVASASAMRIVNGLGLLCIAAAFALGCDNFKCPAPGTSTVAGATTFVGSMATAAGPAVVGDAGASPATGFYGAFAATVALVDFDPSVTNTSGDSQDSNTTYCGPPTFNVSILGVCSLTADTTTILYDTGCGSTGNLVSAGATIRSGQSCEVPVSGGTATVKIDSGTLSLVPGALQLTLAGPAAGAVDGYLTLQFTGK